MALGNNAFLDTNVILDHLGDRQPFAEYAHRLFALAEHTGLNLFASAVSFTNLYYILRKLKGHADALKLIETLNRLVAVTAVTEQEVRAGLASPFADFEDAIQHFSAKSHGDIDVIITRGSAGFAHSEIPVLSPQEFLANLEKRPSE